MRTRGLQAPHAQPGQRLRRPAPRRPGGRLPPYPDPGPAWPPGGLAGGFFATAVGGLHLLGLEGWRFAFHVVAGISIVAGLVVLAIARDPRKKARAARGRSPARSDAWGPSSAAHIPACMPMPSIPLLCMVWNSGTD